MKRTGISLILFLGLVLFLQPVWGEDTPQVEGVLSAQGTLTEVNPQERFFRFKKEKGLDLTYFLDDESVISLNHFATGDFVEIEYVYDKDYRKVVRSLKKLPPPES
jgi:hypothetical protein